VKHRILAGAAAAGALAGAVHAAPALCSVRALRCRLVPDLAGLGSASHVALTFDDGPDPASTPAFLDELDRLGWTATFFLLGSMTRKAPSLVAELVAAGHEVGVHGDEHHSMLERTPRAAAEDIRRGLWTVAEAAGVRPAWFRPPYGTLSTPALVAARRAELHTVLWTAWGRDWREQATPRSVVDDVDKGLGPGATVLLHDSDCTSAPGAWRSALGALPLLAEVFEERGLSVGPLRDHGIRAAAPAG
jgi:peptidoglycan/xylan/chitin deacetylase (PgdA/CDA1 family)